MKNIITISREYCSGGHTIGQLLAKELNIPFYDKEIIDMTAQQSGLSADYIKNNEHSRHHSAHLFCSCDNPRTLKRIP